MEGLSKKGTSMASILNSLSEDLSQLVEDSAPAVVRVEGRRRLPTTGIVWAQDGAIVTAHHGVQRDTGLTVGLAGGETVDAHLVGRDPTTDLALLQAEGAELPAPVWGETEELQVGHLVLALGRPRSRVQATLGIVSALGDSWRTPIGGRVDRYLQTDVVMYPGFSGGPLVGAGGAVLGLNTSGLLRGVSLALPTATVRRVVEELREHGQVRRAFLGVAAQPAELPASTAEELGQASGLLLVNVEADSPAGEAGLLMGDTLVSIDGEPIERLEDLLSQLGGERVGQQANLKLLRGGQLVTVAVTVGERPSQ